jgi:membrane protein
MAKSFDLSARHPEPVSAANSSRPLTDARGRGAKAPTDISPKGWRDVLVRVFYGISEDRITTISAGVTFLSCSLFPGLAGLISLYGLFADSGTIGQHLISLEGILPEGDCRSFETNSSN